MKKVRLAVFTFLCINLISNAAIAASETRGVTTQTAAEAKQREGRTGTSNKEAAKALDNIEKQERRESPKPSPTPKK